MLLPDMSENKEEGLCEVCKGICKAKCSNCKLVFYCSTKHQKEHWPLHKGNCRSYEIRHSKELGRFLVAKRDLDPGDIIFVDTPLVYGPRPHKIEDGPFPCVGCATLLINEIHQCPECLWPACSRTCGGLKIPSIHGCECEILKLRPVDEEKSFYENFRFDVLIVLRTLFLQKINKIKWDVLLNLEDHLDDRGPSADIFKIIQEKVSYIEKNYLAPLKLYEAESGQTILSQVSSDIIHKIYATFDVNATEVTESVDLEILYPTASLLEHNCIPNTSHTIDDKDGYKVTFRAALPILKGEHVTTCYTNILWGTQERRQHLKETKYFSCRCERCRDPTELNTFLSGLICLGTEQQPCKGIQLPQNPIEDNPKWVCNKCGIKLPNKEISEFVNHLSKEVDKEMAKKPKMEELENFLNKLLTFLHPNHYLVYSVRHSLVQLYQTNGNVEISNEFLQEKFKFCQELIDVTKKIDPGNARLTLYLAVLLNEKFLARFKVLTRSFNPDNKTQSTVIVKEVLDILKENKTILTNERKSDSGSRLFNIICIHELKLKTWLQEHEIQIEESK